MKLSIELSREAKKGFRADVLRFFRKHSKSSQVTGAGRFVILEFDLMFPLLWSGASFDHPMLQKELGHYEKVIKRWLDRRNVKYISVVYCV